MNFKVEIEDVEDRYYSDNKVWFTLDSETHNYKIIGDSKTLEVNEIRIKNPVELRTSDSIIEVFITPDSECQLIDANGWKIFACDTKENIQETVEDLVTREISKSREEKLKKVV